VGPPTRICQSVYRLEHARSPLPTKPVSPARERTDRFDTRTVPDHRGNLETGALETYENVPNPRFVPNESLLWPLRHAIPLLHA
jgi:hypothetical protein